MDTNKELLPCPFCGGTNIKPFIYTEDSYCQCADCFCCGASSKKSSEGSAIAIWNTRVLAPPPADTITVQRSEWEAMKRDAYNTGFNNGWDKRNEHLEPIANEYDELIRHMDAGGNFFEFQAAKSTKEDV